jgi:type I restriction enzyme S subunit
VLPEHTQEQQENIASSLDKVNKLISLRKEQIVKLDQLVKSRFIELFGDQETNPYNLNVGKLSDAADIYLGLTHTPTYVEQGKPFLSVRDISSGVIDFSNCHYITEEEFDSLPNGARPKVGDMLFCRVGTIGKPVIIPENTPEFGTFVSVGYLRKKVNVNNYYLKSWMENDYFMRQVYDNVAGASQINLNTGWLKNFRILIPSLELQEQFAAFVEQTDKSKLTIQQSLDKLELMKKALMQEYFG